MENNKNNKNNKNSIKLNSQSPVKQGRIEKAVDALLKWVKSQPKYQKPQLLEHDEFLYMVLTLKKIPAKERTNPYKIPIPNPVFPLDGSQEICLIINDGEKRVPRISSEIAKAKVKEEGLPISKVLKFSKLKTDYKPFEAKRKLCGSFDMFMADRSVIPLLPKHLGKTFYKKKKHPIPVDLSHKQWRSQIALACSCALVYVRGGTCCVVKVGRVSQERDEIVENVSAVIDGLADVVPKKWKNVRSLHLKSLESVALPIYQAVPERPFKIEGVGSGDGLQVLAEKPEENGEDDRASEKEGVKKVFKKGRIHDVQYMDHVLGDLSNGLLGDKDQNEGFLVDEDRNEGLLGDEDQNEALLGDEEHNDGLLDDEIQKEADLPDSSKARTSKIYSGDDKSDGGLLKSTEKNRSGKKVAGTKGRKDLSLEANVASLNDGDVNDTVLLKSAEKSRSGKKVAGTKGMKDLSLEANVVSLNDVDVNDTVPYYDSTPASCSRKKRKPIDSDGPVAVSVKTSAKKGKTKIVEDGTVTNNVKASATKMKTKHYEDGAVTDSVKTSATKVKTNLFEDGAVSNSVKTSAKKGKTKPLRGKVIVA